MDPVPPCQTIKNTYIAMRHGTSRANEEGLIVSDPLRGITKYGLSPRGEQEVRSAAIRAKNEKVLSAETVIIASDFARTRETALIVSSLLETQPVLFSASLRERFFGVWEGTADANYQEIWRDDARDASTAQKGVESVENVLRCATSLIEDLERSSAGKTFLLVSHGDTLAILSKAFRENPQYEKPLALHPAQIHALGTPGDIVCRAAGN